MKAHNKFTVLYTAQINPNHSMACGWSIHRHDSREGAPTVVGNYMTETEAKAACNELNRVSEIQGNCPPQRLHFIPLEGERLTVGGRAKLVSNNREVIVTSINGTVIGCSSTSGQHLGEFQVDSLKAL